MALIAFWPFSIFNLKYNYLCRFHFQTHMTIWPTAVSSTRPVKSSFLVPLLSGNPLLLGHSLPNHGRLRLCYELCSVSTHLYSWILRFYDGIVPRNKLIMKFNDLSRILRCLIWCVLSWETPFQFSEIHRVKRRCNEFVDHLMRHLNVYDCYNYRRMARCKGENAQD